MELREAIQIAYAKKPQTREDSFLLYSYVCDLAGSDLALKKRAKEVILHGASITVTRELQRQTARQVTSINDASCVSGWESTSSTTYGGGQESASNTIYGGGQGSASSMTCSASGGGASNNLSTYTYRGSGKGTYLLSVFLSLILTAVFLIAGKRLDVVHFSCPAWYVIVLYALLAAFGLLIFLAKCSDEEFDLPQFVGFYLICVFGIFFGGMLGRQWIHLILLGAALALILIMPDRTDLSEGAHAIVAPLFVLVPFVLGWSFGLYSVVNLHWAWMALYFACCALGIAEPIRSVLNYDDDSFLAGVFASLCVATACAGLLFGGSFASAWGHLKFVASSVAFVVLTYVANRNTWDLNF